MKGNGCATKACDPVTVESHSPVLDPAELGGVAIGLDLSPGVRVKAGDRGNIGTIIEDLGHNCVVRFVSDEGATATKTLPKSELSTLDGVKLSSESLAISPRFSEAWKIDFFNPPEMARPIVNGLLRTGETMNLIAASKVGKSWLALDLGLSIAAGRSWLGFETEQGRVLLIDNELKEPTLQNRIAVVANARKIAEANIDGRLSYDAIRGRLVDLKTMEELYFSRIEPGQFDVVILDAFYRFLPPGLSENDNAGMTQLYNMLDRITSRLRCAVVVIHHSSKGEQSHKNALDVGSGAGSMGRATDTNLVIRPHEKESHAVVDVDLRSYPPMRAMTIKWDFPVWNPADVEARLKTPQSASESKRQRENESAMREIFSEFKNEKFSAYDVRQLIGFGQERATKFCNAAVRNGFFRKAGSRPAKGGTGKDQILFEAIEQIEGGRL